MPDGETAFVNLDTERYFGLDPVGTRMWEALTTTESLEAAFQSLLAEYEVEGGRLRQDMEELVQSLADQGLIELEDA
jgi:hypothetical protein